MSPGGQPLWDRGVKITQLGLNEEECKLLRDGILANDIAGSGFTSGGHLPDDVNSLTTLEHHFDRLKLSLEQDVEALVAERSSIIQQHPASLVERKTAAGTSTRDLFDKNGNLTPNASEAISESQINARYHDINKEISLLNQRMKAYTHIGDVVKNYRLLAALGEGLSEYSSIVERFRGRIPSRSVPQTGVRRDTSSILGTAARSLLLSPLVLALGFSPVEFVLSPVTLGAGLLAIVPAFDLMRRNRNDSTGLPPTPAHHLDDEICGIFDSTEFFRDSEDTRDQSGHSISQADESDEDQPVQSSTGNQAYFPADNANENPGNPDADCLPFLGNAGERFLDDSECPNPASDISWIAMKKEEAVDRVMACFVRWLDSRIASCIYSHQRGDGSHQDGLTASAQLERGATSTQQSRPSHRMKRPHRQRKSTDANEDEEDDDETPRKRSKRPRVDDTPSEKLACPFFKRHSKKYQFWRSCPGPGWDTVHRVKEHLYRRHALPKFKCYRCRQFFGDEVALSEHSNAEERCDPGQDSIQDGLSDRQIQKLRSRKKTGLPGETQTEEDKWIARYRIIFPDDADVPSPYYTETDTTEVAATTVEQYGSYLRRELPPLMRRELEALMEGEIEERLRSKIIQIMQEVQSQLHQGFRHVYLADQTERDEDGPGSKAAGKMPEVPTGNASTSASLSGPPQPDITEETLFHLDDVLLGPVIDVNNSGNSTMDFGFPSDSGYGSRGTIDPDEFQDSEVPFDFCDGQCRQLPRDQVVKCVWCSRYSPFDLAE